MLGLMGQVGSISLTLSPLYTSQKEPMALTGFSQVPWVDCCFYYSTTTVLLEPGNSLTGVVKVIYQNGLPSSNALPYFILVSSSQWSLDNAQKGFSNSLFRSMPTDVIMNLHDRSITIPFTIATVSEKSRHYFVVVPEQDAARGVLFERIEVDLTVERVVIWILPILVMQIISLASFVALGIDQMLGSRRRRR